MNLRALTSTSLPAPGGAYSHLAEVGGLVFTAGFGPHDPATGEVPAGIETQTEAAIRNVERALAQVGLDLSHVLKATVHLAELERDFAGFNTTYARMFPTPFPVRTTVGSRLLGFLVEIDVVAAGDTR